jgi:Ca-activated chloride channel family protein
MDAPRRPGLPGMVLMLSDGHPTTGLRDTRTLINTLSAENERGHTVIAFSGGNTVNRPLLDMLAYRNKGAAGVAPSIDAMGEDLPKFFQRFERPVLVDCSAEFGRLDESSIVPRQLPDVFADQPVEVYGRFDPVQDNLFAMRLEGEAGGEKHDIVFTKELAQAPRGGNAIARQWAFNTIYALIGEMTRQGETPELRAQVRALSERYDIETPFD